MLGLFLDPWVLSHVCRLWRDKVLFSPTLWKQLILYVGSHRRSSRQVAFWLNLHFDRAGLAIELDVRLVGYAHLEQPTILAAFTRTCTRWRRLACEDPALRALTPLAGLCTLIV